MKEIKVVSVKEALPANVVNWIVKNNSYIGWIGLVFVLRSSNCG